MSNQTFDTVGKLVDALTGGGDSFAKGLKERIAKTQVVSALHAIRVAKDIPQSRIAEELGCTQSRVSKIENGEDSDLKFKEIEAYARVLGSDVHIAFVKRDITSVDRIKAHAFAIKRELDKLAECSQNDDKIANGVAEFMGESLVNLVRFIQSAAEKLPNRSTDGKPHIRISTALSEAVPLDDCDDLLPKLDDEPDAIIAGRTSDLVPA